MASIAALDQDRAEYAALRLRHSYYTGGDRCGRLLAHKLRESRQRQRVPEIRNGDGGRVTEDAEIAEAFHDFYAQLYTGQSLDDASGAAYLAEAHLPTLTKEQADHLEREIWIEEVVAAISRLKPAKSPGPDGYSAAFYKTFCSLVAPLLTRLFNSFTQTVAIPEDMLEAANVVIPKPGKDRTVCGAYRPISLLNIDLKLHTGILTSRLAPYMPGLIDPNQAGFILQRQTSDSTKRVLHLIEKASRTQGEYVLLTIDAEKASSGSIGHTWNRCSRVWG